MKKRKKPSPRKVLLFQLIFGLLLVAATVGLVEAVCRIEYQNITSRSGRWAVAIAQSNTFLRYDGIDPSIENPRFLPHPYMLYQATPNFRNGWGIQHNSLGYRQGEFNPVKKEGTIRILALGGSTTYGASVPTPEFTWPNQLQKILDHDYPNLHYEVINGGLDSASSPEILSGWIFRHRHLHPDIVILNLGVNDIWPLLLTRNYSPEYTYFRRAWAIKNPGPFLHEWLQKSYLVKSIYALTYVDEGDSYPYVTAFDPDLYESEAKTQEATKRVAASDNLGFVRNFDELIKIIKLDNAKVYVMMEPSLPEARMPAKSGWIRGLEHAWMLGFEKNRQIMKDLAIKNGVPYLMMQIDGFKDEWFVDDWYHVAKDGEAEKARRVKDGLAAEHLVGG